MPTRPDERALVALTLAVSTWVVMRHLPPGICFGDGGGLQLASATLGITHPPGYPILASLGFLFTLLPIADPAYMVTVACCLSGVLVLWLCIRLQTHLGVPTALACATSLVLVLHPRFWINLTSPEVYMPSLALQVASLFALARYSTMRNRRALTVGLLLCGVAVVNRPPVAAMLPFVIIAIWISRQRQGAPWRTGATSVLLVAGGVGAAAVLAGSYLWARDGNQTPFNYIRQYNDEFQSLPAGTDGPTAKARRIWWLASAEQFQDRLEFSPPGARARWRRALRQITSNSAWPAWPVLLLAATGAVTAGRRHPAAFLLMLGMLGASTSFIAVYGVTDDAADNLPILFSGTVFCGVALSVCVRAETNRVVKYVSRALVIVLLAMFLARANYLPNAAGRADATDYVRAVGLDALPSHSVVLSGWRTSTPLWYAQTVWKRGTDLTIVNASPGNWARLIRNAGNRPVFSTDRPGDLPGYDVVRHGELWRISHK